MLLPSYFSYLSLIITAGACICVVDARYPITGVKTGINTKTGYRPPRRNLLELINDVPQFSLYIQAMNSMMQVNEENMTSYFQIAGIHGRPFIAWDDVNPASPSDGFPIGYCAHGNTLFGLWHRPYLALIEQVMAQFAQKAAKAYKSRVYQNAADNLRIPYWDWAEIPRFPDIMTRPTVKITTPTGVKHVTNPLNRYKFLSHPERESWFPSTVEPWFPPVNNEVYLGAQPWTLRRPNAKNISVESDINNQGFNKEGTCLTNEVWDVFTNTRDFNNMTTSANGGTAFESPHDTVHLLIAGNGHMGPITFSGFEPAFWLHHANIDRLIAMWQAIYPDAWIKPTISQSGSWTIYPGKTKLDESTPLAPFTTGDGQTPYTSVTSRYTKYFGYSYPDVQDWRFPNPKALSAHVKRRVNQLYNPRGHLRKWPDKRTSMHVKRDSTREWSVSVSVPNQAIGELFSVKILVGDVMIGRLTVLQAPSRAEVDAGMNRVTNGKFTLKNAITGDPGDVAGVIAQLKGNVKCIVVRTRDGIEVDNAQVKGLVVVVADEVVQLSQDISEFPTFGERTVHPEITL